MFGIGETELVIIVVFAFLLFGPDKLPGMGRTLGRVIRQFREASDGFTEVVQTNIMDPASEELEKSPKQRKREEAALQGTDEATDASSQEEVEPKRETFAERRARLLAERKAAEEVAAAASADVVQTEDNEATSSVEGPVPASAPEPELESDSEPASAPEPESEPARTSAADLYAMTSAKSSRMQAKEASKEADQQADQTGEEDGSAEA